MEEKTDEQEEAGSDAVIQFDPNRKANIQNISVRLQLFASYPEPFDAEDEQKAREEFTRVFQGR